MAIKYLTPGQVYQDGDGEHGDSSPIAPQTSPQQGEKGRCNSERDGAVDSFHFASVPQFERGQ